MNHRFTFMAAFTVACLLSIAVGAQDEGDASNDDDPRPPAVAQTPQRRVTGAAQQLPGQDARPQSPLYRGIPFRTTTPGDPRSVLLQLRESDPEMHKLRQSDLELEKQTRDLVAEYHKPTADREQVRAELTGVIEKHFAVRQERRELEIKSLEKQLARLRDSLKKRESNRQQIIDRHIAELLGTADELGF